MLSTKTTSERSYGRYTFVTRLWHIAHATGYEPDAPAGALPEGSSFGDCLFEVGSVESEGGRTGPGRAGTQHSTAQQLTQQTSQPGCQTTLACFHLIPSNPFPSRLLRCASLPAPQVAHDGCGWVHSVTFAAAAAGTASPGTSGAFPQLLYASHDFTVGVVDAAGGAPAAAAAVRLPDAVLPLNCLAVVVPGRLAVGGGWSGGLAVLRNMGSGWQLAATLGTRDAAAGAGGAGAGAGASGGGGGGGGSAVARQIAAMNLNAVNMVAPGGGAASTAGGCGLLCHYCVTSAQQRHIRLWYW